MTNTLIAVLIPSVSMINDHPGSTFEVLTIPPSEFRIIIELEKPLSLKLGATKSFSETAEIVTPRCVSIPPPTF